MNLDITLYYLKILQNCIRFFTHYLILIARLNAFFLSGAERNF